MFDSLHSVFLACALSAPRSFILMQRANVPPADGVLCVACACVCCSVVLVQIVKQEWPEHWPNFIPELVNSSKTSQSLCANNMNILLLLSEEVFDFSNGQMTQDKMKQMKKNLNREFTLIFQLCEYILDHSTEPALLTETLRTLLRFLHWIPIRYIFETTSKGWLIANSRLRLSEFLFSPGTLEEGERQQAAAAGQVLGCLEPQETQGNKDSRERGKNRS